MAYGIFFGTAHLCEGAGGFVGMKHGIVTEAAVACRSCSDRAIYPTLKKPYPLTFPHQCNHRKEMRLAIGNTFEIGQQFAHIGLRIVPSADA